MRTLVDQRDRLAETLAMMNQAFAQVRRERDEAQKVVDKVEGALAEYGKVPREVWIGRDDPGDKVTWLVRRMQMLEQGEKKPIKERDEREKVARQLLWYVRRGWSPNSDRFEGRYSWLIPVSEEDTPPSENNQADGHGGEEESHG